MPSVTPICVSNNKLNCLIFVKSDAPHFGHLILFSLINSSNFSLDHPSPVSFPSVNSSINLSARALDLHFLQSIKGSEKLDTCPLATQTSGFIRIAASSPYELGLSSINLFHQAFFILFLSSTPKGP